MTGSRISQVYGLLALGALLGIAGCRPAATSSLSFGDYPYGSPSFQVFVQDSYEATGKGNPDTFHQWMADAAPAASTAPKRASTWAERLEAKRIARARLPSAKARAVAERQEVADLHAWEKKAIPRFSLDRGFEFSSVVSLGERQCLLQSVLLASLLQKSGIDAGAVMVYRNGEGEESNIGHVVTLVKLSDGRDVLADASHKAPFVRQTGLYTWVKGLGYRFLEPVFQRGSTTILSYRLASSGRRVPTADVRGLNIAFLRSQFAYYRGERTPGGVLYRNTTRVGLQLQSARFRDSVAKCPSNPLATYMLGRVCLQTGRIKESTELLDKAYSLYRVAGWMPPDVPSYRLRAHSRAQSGSERRAG